MITEQQYGLLSDTEREWLGDASKGSDAELDRDKLIDDLRGRLRLTLTDIEELYMCLTDEELATIFDDPDDEFSSIRSSAQYLLAFLYLGLDLNGDDVEYRLASAIEQAEATNNRRATVQLDILTEPFLPPKQRLKALEEEEFGRVSFEAFEQLFYDDRVPPEDLATALSTIEGEEVNPERIRQEREMVAEIERLPTAVVVGMERVDFPEDQRDDESSESSRRGDE